MNENLTFNQINQQESSAYRNGLTGRKAMPTVLIERSDGRVMPGSLDLSTQNVHFSEGGQNMMHPNVPLERLSDSYQEVLAAKLAGVALHGGEVAVATSVSGEIQEGQESRKLAEVDAEIAEVEAAIDALDESMLESDRRPAWRFAVALHNHERSSAQASLSERGKAQARTYRDLYVQLRELRGRRDQLANS